MKSSTLRILAVLCTIFIATSACKMNIPQDAPTNSIPAQASQKPVKKQPTKPTKSKPTKPKPAPPAKPAVSTKPLPRKPPTTFNEFIDQLIIAQAETHCRNAFECPAPDLGDYSVERLSRLGDQKSCIDYLKQENPYTQRPQNRALIQASIAAGRAQFKPKQAEACLTAYKNYGANCVYPKPEVHEDMCDRRSIKDTLKKACRDIIHPLLDSDFQLKNECTSSLECIDGDCYQSDYRGNDTTQHCHQWEARCDNYNEHGEGSWCNPESESSCNDFLYCSVNNHCKPMKASGKNKPCSDETGPICQAGLYCALNKKCAPLPIYGKHNSSCNQVDKRCRAGLVCAGLKPGPNNTVAGTCQSIRTQYDDCQQTQECRHDQYCNGTIRKPGICQRAKSSGHPCSPSNSYDSYLSECGDSGKCADDDDKRACQKRHIDGLDDLHLVYSQLGTDPLD